MCTSSARSRARNPRTQRDSTTTCRGQANRLLGRMHYRPLKTTPADRPSNCFETHSVIVNFGSKTAHGYLPRFPSRSLSCETAPQEKSGRSQLPWSETPSKSQSRHTRKAGSASDADHRQLHMRSYRIRSPMTRAAPCADSSRRARHVRM